MKAWPFTFAASRTLDYQFVVLPEILDVQSGGLLRDRLEMDEADPRRLRMASFPSPQGGTLACVYRSGPILAGDEVHVDSAGRKLLFASGLVVEDLPETLDEPSRVIDANGQWFERGLISFLNSSESWTPIIAKSFDLAIDMPRQISGRVRKLDAPVAILSLISILLLVLCVGLYVQMRSLEAQLSPSNSPAPKSIPNSDPTQNPDRSPGEAPAAPEDKSENKPAVQPSPAPSLPSSVPEDPAERKAPPTTQPTPAPGSTPSVAGNGLNKIGPLNIEKEQR